MAVNKGEKEMKKVITIILTCTLLCTSALGVSAKEMSMYIRNQFVKRDVVDLNGWDMLPIADIAGELGYTYSSNGNTFTLSSDYNTYKFTMGSASVYDKNGKWYGLDVVPQKISGKLRIPAKFVMDVLHMSYTWDSVTNTIFIGSENTYNWLINTSEYKEAKAGKTSAPATTKLTYSTYPGTIFRTFTDVTGISVKSTSYADTSTIYDYGKTSFNNVYAYVLQLKSDGLTYNGTEVRGTTTIISFWGANKSLILISHDSLTNIVKILV